VNRAKETLGLKKLSVRHRDKIGVLLRVFEILAVNNVNIQELENIVFAEREAAVANFLLSGDCNMEEMADSIKKCEHILDCTF
jgi:predicted amino acid-binding ACT domain protein